MNKIDKHILDLISAYATKNITPQQLEELKEWLNEDSRHREYFQEHINLYRAIREHGLSDQIDKTKAWKNVRSAIHTDTQEVTSTSKASHLQIHPWWGYAAAACIALVVTFCIQYDVFRAGTSDSYQITQIPPGTDKAELTLENGKVIPLGKGVSYSEKGASSTDALISYTPQSTEISPVYNYLTVPKGGQFSLQLSDGTRVWLNSDSKLKYPTSFVDGATREVELLYGEAYFDISPSTEHGGSKFQVLSNLQRIEVLGTEFNVKAYKEEDYVYTTLVEGKVEIQKNDSKYILLPNQQSVTSHNHTEGNLVISQVDVKPEIAWKEGVFSFKSKSLGEIMLTISRWYDVEIFFDNEKLRDVKFNGVLSKKQHLKNVLHLIKSTQYINDYEIKSNNRIFIK